MNKSVFHIEYPDGSPNITPDEKAQNCDATSAQGFSTVVKTIDLDPCVDPCAWLSFSRHSPTLVWDWFW